MTCAITGRSLIKFFKNFTMFTSAETSSSFSSFFASKSSSITSAEHYCYLSKTQEFIPKLNLNLHKGSCGRIGVIGGSFEYTGAPYFAAISALKLGADLVHVFCCAEAGPVIKSYSPELIVHPFLEKPDVLKKIQPWLEVLHALVIGPGMGRETGLMKNVSQIIRLCNTVVPPLPLIIDADGLFLITENLELVKNYKGPLILTPNSVEYMRLSSKMGESDPMKIASSLNAVLLQKGYRDIITNGMLNRKYNLSHDDFSIICDCPGSNRRCGGQGDILSGYIATFVGWLQIHLKLKCLSAFELENEAEYLNDPLMWYSCAVYSACVVTRTCSRLAYEEKGRSMTASDMIQHVQKAFTLYFGI